jgi:hypothetical protein
MPQTGIACADGGTAIRCCFALSGKTIVPVLGPAPPPAYENLPLAALSQLWGCQVNPHLLL